MEYLKITAVLLLLAQIPHITSLQNSTDSTGRPIDPSWLRKIRPNFGTTLAEESELDQGSDGLFSTSNPSDGIASGFMSLDPEEENSQLEQNVVGNVTAQNFTFVPTTLNPQVENGMTSQQERLNLTLISNITITIPSNVSKINSSEAEKEFNSTATESTTSSPASSNDTGLVLTTLDPEKNTMQNSSVTPEADEGLKNQTGSTQQTLVTTAAGPENYETSTTSSSTSALPSETTNTSTESVPPNTPERADKTGKGASSSEKEDFNLNDYHSKRNVAWVAVLGTAAAAACVGLVAYIILRKKHQKGFTHRKLVEEYPSDPVLRLDNSEPLDLNFGSSAYYNPGLQGDFIQMNNIR